MKKLIRTVAIRIKKIKGQLNILFCSVKHPRTPWYAKLLIAAVIAYALSPVDLIPDFIPVLGYLDDLIILPLGIWIALKLIPVDVISDCKTTAEDATVHDKSGLIAATVIVFIWVSFVVLLLWWLIGN